MNYQNNDPGATQFGNFINYYQFNSAEDRIKLLPTHLWNSQLPDSTCFVVLDVGCNAGNLTQLLYEYLKKHIKLEIFILGIDLDPILIKRANEHNAYPNNVVYECIDIMSASDSCFKGYLQMHDKLLFDAIFCLSITMWIHLNHGDDGLIEFLSKMKQMTQFLIIEPQPWRCYTTALRRLKRANHMFNKFKELKIRDNVEIEIESILKNLKLQKIYETLPTKWNRKICFYSS